MQSHEKRCRRRGIGDLAMVTAVCECNTDELGSHFLTPIKGTGNCVEKVCWNDM